MPDRCAVVTTSIQALVGSLPLVSTQRTSSSRISAAVPGIESSPASLRPVSHSRDRHVGPRGAVDDLHRAEGVQVHAGHARASPRGPGRSRPCRGRLGSMPPCMQISVAPSARGLAHPVADLVDRQRVGVGVGGPLGERAEPAAGVADVGEVDVPVDDVGDVVADGVAAQLVGQRATASRPAPSAVIRVSACASVSSAGSRSACRRAASDVGVQGRIERAGVGPASATSVPVAVDLVEVRAAVVVRPSVSTAVCRSVRPLDDPLGRRAPATAGRSASASSRRPARPDRPAPGRAAGCAGRATASRRGRSAGAR